MISSYGPSIHGGTVTYDVFVGHLPLDITRERVENHYRPFGKIHSVVVRDSNRGPDEKISYVRFLSETDAQNAVDETRGTEILGHKIIVRRAECKKRTPGQGGGGDGQTRPQNFNRPSSKPQMMGEKPDLVTMGRPLMNNRMQMNNQQPQVGSQLQSEDHSQMVSQSQMDNEPLIGNPPQISHWQAAVPSEPEESRIEKPLANERMIVSYVHGPHSFWGQMIKDNSAQELIKLSEDLASICPSSTPVDGKPDFSKVYGALFSEDGQWYRCQPLSVISDTMTVVQYIDYGNNERVENSKIVEIPNTLLSAPPHAEKYVLLNVEPTSDDIESDQYRKAVDYLKDITDGKLLDAAIYGDDPLSGAVAVELSFEGEDINTQLVEKGYLKKRTVSLTDHMNLKGPRNVPMGGMEENMMPQREPREKGGYPYQNAGQRDVPWGTPSGEDWGSPSPELPGQEPAQWGGQPQVGQQQSMPNQSNWGQPQQQTTYSNQMMNRQVTSPGSQMNRGGMGQGKGGPGQRQDNLQLKVEKANREIMKLQTEFSKAVTEKDAALLELGTLKGRMKLVTEECAAVSKRAHDLNISNKLKILMSTVNKVKLMRIQFPTDDSSPDLIQNAINLVTATDVKITPDMELIRMVQVALTRYNECQMKIKQCQDLAELEGLISERNESRKVLHEKLDYFLQATKALPVEARGSALRESINHLKLTYATFKVGTVSSGATLEEVIQKYQEWRKKMNAVYYEVRTQTNTAHNMVDSSLKAIQELLSLDFIMMPESKIIPPDLDGLIDKLQVSVVREMEMSDLERSGFAALVSRTLSYLVDDMMAELKSIDQLAAMQNAYSVMKESLVQWLDEKPDLGPLQAIRKNFKGLKSKLRHKLADKHDAEESDEDQEDLIRINLELAQIRVETHATYLAEDEQMVKLAELYTDHFPELSLQHPEIAIDKYVEYGGLLKLGLDLDQFDLQPLPENEKSSVYQTVFNRDNAILKEFILDETMGIIKDEFLARAVAYSQLKHGNLLKIEALFFHKNKRQAYLLFKQHTTLTSQLNDGSMDEVAIHKCLLGVLRGLTALHEVNIVHGAIKPENILLDSEGNGILTDFDFTKSLGQRACCLNMLKTGLILNAPETRISSDVTKAVDIYSFGVLFVMMHFPTRTFRCAVSGIPIVENTGWAQPTVIMLENLLSLIPNNRISAKNLLTLPYFHNPCIPKEHTEVKDGLQLGGKEPSPTSESVPAESLSEIALVSTLPESDLGEQDLEESANTPLPEDEMPELDESCEDQYITSENEVVPEPEGLSHAIPDVVTQAADVPAVSSTDDDAEEVKEEESTSPEGTTDDAEG